MLSQAERNEIEALIDRHSAVAVLDAVATICHDKADHVAHTWQDYALSRLWTRAASKIERTAASVAGLFIP